MRRGPRAQVILPTGRTKEVSRLEALRMLANSEADLVSSEPPVVRAIHTPEYDEERRFLSGRLVNRSYPETAIRTRHAQPLTPGNRTAGKARVYRTRTPRGAQVITDAERSARRIAEEYRRRRGWVA